MVLLTPCCNCRPLSSMSLPFTTFSLTWSLGRLASIWSIAILIRWGCGPICRSSPWLSFFGLYSRWFSGRMPDMLTKLRTGSVSPSACDGWSMEIFEQGGCPPRMVGLECPWQTWSRKRWSLWARLLSRSCRGTASETLDSMKKLASTFSDSICKSDSTAFSWPWTCSANHVWNEDMGVAVSIKSMETCAEAWGCILTAYQVVGGSWRL